MDTSLRIYATSRLRLDYGPHYTKLLNHTNGMKARYGITYTEINNQQYGLQTYNKPMHQPAKIDKYKILKQLYEINKNC